MNPSNKKWLIGGAVVAGLAVTGVWLSSQIKKIMNYTLAMSKIKVNTVSVKILDFNVYFDYTNNSDIDVKLAEQEYDIYINSQYITTLTNYSENILKANAVSQIGFNVRLDLPALDKKLKTNYVKMLLDPKAVEIKIDMKWKVRLWFIKIPIKYPWVTNLKEILGWYLPVYRK